MTARPVPLGPLPWAIHRRVCHASRSCTFGLPLVATVSAGAQASRIVWQAWAAVRALSRMLRDSRADSSARCIGGPPSVHGGRIRTHGEVGRTYLNERIKYRAINTYGGRSLLSLIAASLSQRWPRHPLRRWG